MTITGTQTQINNLLAGNGGATVTYLDNTDTPSATVTLTLTVNDNGLTGTGGPLSASDTATINITAVDDAPVATITPTSYGPVNEQTSLTLHGTGLSISDVDAGSGSLTVTLSVTEGTLNVTGGSTGAGVSASGSSLVTITGTQTQINNLLAGNGGATVTYLDNTDTPSATVTLTLTVNDNGLTGTGGPLSASDTATINITAVDDAPVATITPTSYGPVNEQTSLTLHGTGLSISDVDAGSGSLTVTLSVTEGTLNVTGGSTGAGVSASGSSLVTITGTQTQINNLLAGNGGATVTYLDNTDTPSATVTLTLTVNDNGLTGTGGPLSASDTATINITAVNDAPVIDLLTTAGVQTTAITAAFTESGGAVTVAPQLTLADVDSTTAAGATVTLTNAQTGDVLSLQGQAGTSGTLAGGIGFSISGSTVTFSNVSLLANYQAALQLVQFNNTSVNPITTDRSFAFQIDDGGVVNNLANATATVTIGTVNHAPTTADTSASGAEDGGAIAIVLSGNDIDGTVASFTITSLPTNGTLSTDAAGLNPVALNQLITASGNAATLYFTPAANFNGAPSFQYAAIDNNGAQDATPATATINITAVDDAPVATITPTSYGPVNEQTSLTLHGTGLSISDVDAGSGSLTVTLSVTEGTLNVTGGSTGAGVSASGSSLVTITGTQTQINNLLAGNGGATVTYLDNTDTPSATVTLTLTVNDNGLTGTGGPLSASDTATINITAVDDAPVATITPTSYGPVNEQTSLTLHGTGLSISDVDAGSGSLTVTLSVTEGTLNVTGGSTGAGVSASGSSLVTITGTQTQINNLLAGNGGATVTYLDNTDTPSATVTLTLTVNDNGLTGTGGPLSASDTATINITAVDDAPVATITPTSYGPVNEQTSLTLHGTGLSISDVDAGSGSLTVTLSVTEGTLNVTGGSTGAGVSASGSSLVTITGTQTQINNLLAGNGGATVTYLDNTDTPSATVTLTLTVNDNGLTGTGGPLSASDTATINITAVNDAPVIDLLTTAGVQTTAITAAFTESGGAVTVAPQLTLADVDSTTAAGATVTLTNAQTGDVLSLQGQAGTSGTLAGGIGFSISGSTVTFSNVSLLANYQAALQLVQFNNTSVNPITTDRSFAFQIDDGGVVNNLANATATVTIGTVNHAPTTADTSASGAEDGGAIAIVLSGNDIDGTVASFAITSLPTNGTLSTDAAGLNPVALNQLITASGNAATLYFTPAANFNGAPSFQYAAIDNNGAQDATPATATINITAVDDAPVATITPTSYGPVNEQTSLTLHGTGLSISEWTRALAR